MDYAAILTNLINNIEMSKLVLFVCSGVLAYVLYKAHVNPGSFDLKDMLRQSESGKADIYKFGQMICLFVSSWLIIYLASNKTITEYYFGLYMLAWAGSTALNKYLGQRLGTSTVESTTESTVASTSTSVVQSTVLPKKEGE